VAEEKGGVTVFSVLKQEKTALRDGRGMTVYRRLYLCDEIEDVAAMPRTDAPGSGVIVADGGAAFLLNHRGEWCPCEGITLMGGGLWKD
jgi:hypothetical protein